jgi:hypothetical protein
MALASTCDTARMASTDRLDQQERESDLFWVADDERLRLLVALYRSEVSVLGRPVRLAWPEGEPDMLRELLDRLAAQLP